jgi:hypothetical protein
MTKKEILLYTIAHLDEEDCNSLFKKIIGINENKESCIDFAKWLWDMDRIKINIFESPEQIVEHYKKTLVP